MAVLNQVIRAVPYDQPGTPTGVKPIKRLLGTQGANVASANDLTLGYDGNFFLVTGTTTINGIATEGWTAGSMVILQTEGSLTIKHDTAPSAGFAKIIMQTASDATQGAGWVIPLVFDGTVWQELTRYVD